jgi:hypothetical protein
MRWFSRLLSMFEPRRPITLPFPLDGPDERARAAALRRLAPGAAPGWDRLSYVRYLREHYPADLAERWEPLAADPEPWIRREIVGYLREYSPHELTRRADQFRDDPDPEIRVAIACSVARTDGERAVWLLIDLLPDWPEYDLADTPWELFRQHGTRPHLEELERRHARTGAADSRFADAADEIRQRLWQAGDYTAAEWDDRAYPPTMLGALRGRVSDRQVRLFAAACCRRAWHHLADERSRRAVAVAERFADGAAGPADLQAAYEATVQADEAMADAPASARSDAAWGAAWAARWTASPDLDVEGAIQVTGDTNRGPTQAEGWAEAAAQAAVLKDIVGNPFGPAPAAGAWRTETALHLAEAIYDARAFGLLPILADALEETGCVDAALLAHCRSGGAHVRGCWALDRVLGRQ